MDYLDAINDPLKVYFKEKMGNLYINENVVRMLVEKGQRGEGQKLNRLADSFFNQSSPPEHEDSSRRPSKVGSGLEKSKFTKNARKRRSSIELYEKARQRKMTEGSVQSPLLGQKHMDTGINKIDRKLDQFSENNNLMKSNLDLQSNSIECKIYARKQKSVIKGGLTRTASQVDHEHILGAQHRGRQHRFAKAV